MVLHPHLVFQGQLLREELQEPSYWRLPAPALSRASRMTRCYGQKTGLSEWTTLDACIPASMLSSHLSVVVAGSAGLLGVVGDGCSCFSMVSFTSSCSQIEKTVDSASSINTPQEDTASQQRPYLHSIQHRFDDIGDGRHIFLVLQIDAIQHYLVCPAYEVGQTLIHTAMARRQRRTVGKGDWTWVSHVENR